MSKQCAKCYRLMVEKPLFSSFYHECPKCDTPVLPEAPSPKPVPLQFSRVAEPGLVLMTAQEDLDVRMVDMPHHSGFRLVKGECLRFLERERLSVTTPSGGSWTLEAPYQHDIINYVLKIS